jgi:hypothetical protein
VAAGFEILPGLPSSGPLPEQFSSTGHGTHSEGFVVRFLPEQSSPWVGNFQGGFGKCQGVFVHPNGCHLIVVATGQAYIVEPESRALLDHFGADIASVVEVPEIDALLFTNGLWFEAYGASGLLWRSRRVSWDGVRSLSRTKLTLHGEAYSPLDDAWHPFSLDLASGHAKGGSYTGPQI